MTINHILPGQVRANGVDRAKGNSPSKGKGSSSESSSGERSDRVEISAEGRIRAQAALQEGSGLSQERLAEIRQRIEDGTYDTPDMAEQVARRILSSGDL
jgi:flagellar biosynthesis anti-sigma factor FlgM